MGEQHLGDPGIFGDHRVGGGERRQGAQRNVPEIADRRRDDVQPRLKRLRLGAKAKGDEAAMALAIGIDRLGFGLAEVCAAHDRSSKKMIRSLHRTHLDHGCKALFYPQNYG